jgi:hypothetical protein
MNTIDVATLAEIEAASACILTAVQQQSVLQA